MKVKSSLLAVYLGASSAATTYNRVGANCESLNVNLNPTETEYADVTMDVKQTDLESYKVTVEGSGKYDKDDPVYEIFYNFYRNQVVLDNAKLPLLIVHRFDEDAADLYEDTTVVINSITLTGAESLEVDFKLSTNASPKSGIAYVSSADNYKTATFTPDTDTYTTTVTSSGHGTATASPSRASAGTEITLSAVPDEGYEFDEWTVTSGGVSIVNNKFTMPERDVAITASFKAQV